jgi:SAM-dependent methyltransferase
VEKGWTSPTLVGIRRRGLEDDGGSETRGAGPRRSDAMPCEAAGADYSGAVATPILLPPRSVVPKTAADDPVDYYYKPLTGRIYRARLRLAADLLGDGRHDALLEVGYGSGIFLPELARRADRLAAIDIHPQAERVREMLLELGVAADLREGSLFELPYGDGEFDALVCLSVLEHIVELDAALSELRRVLRPGGIAVCGFPVRNPVTDAFFRALGYKPREIHPSGHRDILAAVRRSGSFVVEQEARFPRIAPLDLAGYAGCRCRAVQSARVPAG